MSQIPENTDDLEIKHEIEEKYVDTFKNKTYLHIVDWPLQVRLEAALIHFHSPYPEIRAITEPFDDPSIPVETFRVYFIGLFGHLWGR